MKNNSLIVLFLAIIAVFYSVYINITVRNNISKQEYINVQKEIKQKGKWVENSVNKLQCGNESIGNIGDSMFVIKKICK